MKKRKYSFYNLINAVANKTWKSTIYSEDSAQGLYHVIRTYMEENPDKTDEEVYEYLDSYIEELRREIYDIRILNTGVIEKSLAGMMLSDQRYSKKLYDRIIEEEQRGKKIEASRSIIFDGDIEKLAETIMKENILAMREMDINNAKVGLDEKAILDIMKKKQTNRRAYNASFKDGSKLLMDAIIKMQGKTDFEKTMIVMDVWMKSRKDHTMDDFVSNLQIIGDRLDGLGMLEKNNRSYISFLESFNLEGMEYRTKDDKPLKEVVFGEETIRKFSVPELSAISAFWVNRYAKELENVGNTYFTIKELDLVPAIRKARVSPRSGMIRVDVDRDELAVVHEKNAFLTNVLKICIEDIIEKSKSDPSLLTPGSGSTMSIEISSKFEEIASELEEEYSKYFSRKDPKHEHHIIEDIRATHSIQESIINMYNKKDMDMILLLYCLENHSISNNWGVIIEEGKDISRQSMVIIGVDLDGVNMPIRLHMRRDKLMDYLQKNHGNTMIRVYEGDDDFRLSGRTYSTQIISPSGKKQGNFLKGKKESETNVEKRNLIEHLLFLHNKRLYPEHLMVEREVERKVIEKRKVKGKNKTKEIIKRERVKVRPNTRYVDLKSKTFYEKNFQNQFVSISAGTTPGDDSDGR